MARNDKVKIEVNASGDFGKDCPRDHKHDKTCDNYYVKQLYCQPSLVIRQDPPGDPPIVPPPFPLTAYGFATIDVTNNILHVGGLQGFLPNGDLAPTWDQRVRVAYDSMFAIARFYGAQPIDALEFLWIANPDSPIAKEQIPGDFGQRFNAIRDLANSIQQPIYGNFPPARTVFGVTFIVLDDVFEIKSMFKLPGKNVVCNPRPKYLEAVKSQSFASNRRLSL
jgi:hypothetical protein